MTSASKIDWHEANQRYLMAALGLVREALERHVLVIVPVRLLEQPARQRDGFVDALLLFLQRLLRDALGHGKLPP